MRQLLYFFGIVVLFSACNPIVLTEVVRSKPILDFQQEVRVFELDQPTPSGATLVGKVKVDDSGFSTNCRYETVLDFAKVEALKMGGNTLKITSHKYPDFFSSCHRITADILLLDSISIQNGLQDTLLAARSDSNTLLATSPLAKKKYPFFRLALNAGPSSMIGKIPSNLSSEFIDYTKELSSGFNLGTDISFYYNETSGMGMKLSTFKTSNSMDNIYLEDDLGNRTYGSLSDDITMTFFGPSFTYRKMNPKKKNAMILTTALGYNLYSNHFVVIDPYIMTGEALGVSIDFGYDFELSKSLALGLQFSLTTGVLKELQLTDGSNTERVLLSRDSYISLNHFDFSVGLRFLK